ncbi:hypothetical protein AHF37_10416 [Paragonimus kellicotti]|nr:hypothetical protein AHF37_10416 [Paragonimus kellicotti]
MANHISEIKQSAQANGDSLPSEKPLPVPPEHLPKYGLRGVRAGLCVVLLLISAYLGSIFLQGPLLPLAFIAPRLFRRTVDWTIASWLMFTEFLTVKLMQVRVRQFGDSFNTISDRPRVSLLLLNHRTQLDWFFSWGLGVPVQKMKIILKEPLARLPGAGWAMQCGAFVFLRRQIATDQARIVKLVSYLLNVDRNCEVSLVAVLSRNVPVYGIPEQVLSLMFSLTSATCDLFGSHGQYFVSSDYRELLLANEFKGV